MAHLELQNVSVSFGPAERRNEVLTNINLSVAEGEFVAIVGAPDVGKSTLLSLIAGLVSPTAGRITLDGIPITGPSPDRGLVFQNYSLLLGLTVWQNVAHAVQQSHPQWGSQARELHVEKYVDLLNLAASLSSLPGELSVAVRQRVMIARALAMSPRVLLFDEPLGPLDAVTRFALEEVSRSVTQRDCITVVMIAKDVDDGILLADRIIPLSPEPHATLGPAISVNIPRPRTRKLLDHHPRAKKIRSEVLGCLAAQEQSPGALSASLQYAFDFSWPRRASA